MSVIKINNMTYKFGLHGMVFMRLNGAWVKSTKTKEDLAEAIKRQARIIKQIRTKEVIL